MDPRSITPGALDTWAKLSPKSAGRWMWKLALSLAVLIAPWFLIPWRYAILYVLLVWAIENAIRDAVPEIVALTKQELGETSGSAPS